MFQVHTAISAAPTGVTELSADHLDAICGGTASETAQGVALVVSIAAEAGAVLGLNVAGALLGATHTKN
jgi:hypothetical protein